MSDLLSGQGKRRSQKMALLRKLRGKAIFSFRRTAAAFSVRQNRGAVGDGGEDDDGFSLDDAGGVFDAGKEFFQRLGAFRENFQRVIKIAGDVITFFDFAFGTFTFIS